MRCGVARGRRGRPRRTSDPLSSQNRLRSGRMRLGILGPAHDDVIGLARAAQILLDEAHAEKVIYLADDGALERVVVSWAHEIVGANPSDEALFKRAAVRCAKAVPDDIDQFVEGER